jgi:hypothetical protein
LGEKWPVNLACDFDFHVNRRDLLHAASLRHGTDGCGFYRPKNPTASGSWVPEASMLTTRPPKPLRRGTSGLNSSAPNFTPTYYGKWLPSSGVVVAPAVSVGWRIRIAIRPVCPVVVEFLSYHPLVERIAGS